MKATINLILVVLFELFFTFSFCQSSGPNLFIITTDGLRWQEIFNGTDESYYSNKIKIQEISDNSLISSKSSRASLMPFVWDTFIHYGSIYGNRNHNNLVNTRNYYRFSYPGYSELFCGVFDPSINSNGKYYNKNASILEVLNQNYIYKNNIAAFTSWEVFPYILNEPRSGVMVNAGWESITSGWITPAIAALNELVETHSMDKNQTRSDDITWSMAIEYTKVNHPKVMYISLDQTDHFGHQADYPAYLQAIRDFDKNLRELWSLIQSDPFYLNNTYLLITTDHGRGSSSTSWRNHGFLPARSGEMWYMEYGPDIESQSEVTRPMQQYQISLTSKMAEYLNFNFTPHKFPILSDQNSEILLANSRQE